MAYMQQATTSHRHTIATPSATLSRKRRKRLFSLRYIRQALHFIGFLAYWTISFSVVCLGVMLFLLMFICLS